MRLIDADALLKEIEELKKSPWFNYGRGACNPLHGLYLERKEAVEMVEDICIKQAPTIKAFTLADIEEQYRKGLEKGLEEAEPKKCPICGSDLYEYCFMCCYEGEKVKQSENSN